MPPTVKPINNTPSEPVKQEVIDTPVEKKQEEPVEPTPEVETTPEEPKEIPISEDEFLSLLPKEAYQVYLQVLNERDTSKAEQDKKAYEAAEAVRQELGATHQASLDEIKQQIKEIMYGDS